jgi:hypothetical protein
LPPSLTSRLSLHLLTRDSLPPRHEYADERLHRLRH